MLDSNKDTLKVDAMKRIITVIIIIFFFLNLCFLVFPCQEIAITVCSTKFSNRIIWKFQLIAKGKDVSELFAAVVKNVAAKNVELRKLVFVYLVRYAEEQQDLALLSISTFQRALKVAISTQISRYISWSLEIKPENENIFDISARFPCEFRMKLVKIYCFEELDRYILKI